MNTIKIKAENIDGVNGIFVKTDKRHSVTNIKIYEEGEGNNADCN